MMDGNSRSQSALLLSNTGFFGKLRIVLITFSAIEGFSSVYFDYWFTIDLERLRKMMYKTSAPRPDSILKSFRFDLVRSFEKSTVIVSLQ